MELFLSIVIPTYNRANLLKITLQSLLVQSYPCFEILVIDDGGSDHTKEMILELKDPRITYYWKENAERGAARNYGAKLAKGEYLNFFDSDDIAYENHLQVAVDYILANPDVITFHTGFDWKNAEMKKIADPVVNVAELNRRVFKKNILGPNNVFLRKKEFDQLRFSEDRKLISGEDWQLWLRVCSRYPMIGLPQITSSMIEHKMRSMNKMKGDDMILSGKVLIQSLCEDEFLFRNNHSCISMADAEMQSLAALYYSMEGKKKECIKYFFKSSMLRPAIIFSRRTLAIFKYLLIK